MPEVAIGKLRHISDDQRDLFAFGTEQTCTLGKVRFEREADVANITVN